MRQLSGNTESGNHYDQLRSILGKKYIRRRIDSPFDFIPVADRGVNAQVINNFRNYFDIDREVTADLLNVSEPTIYRWLRNNKKLDRNYAIQLFELADLFLYGIEVFSDKENFFKWLDLPNTAIGTMKPMDLLDIPNGIAKVRDLLGRIEYGVYS